MAFESFGNPITDETLKEMPKYSGKTISRKDRAYEALKMKNSEQKDEKAHTYVKKLKSDYGIGISTLCLVYNATGDPVSLVTYHDWWGHIGSAPYPLLLENGQWGAFLHVHANASVTGSQGAVVYRGLSCTDDNKYDWMLSWDNPGITLGNNHAYTEIFDVDHFNGDGIWSTVQDKTGNSNRGARYNSNGCLSIVSIGEDTSPLFEAILTQDGLM
ncbi:hypothetical protein ACFE04_030982 [Oxalis oulophora]